MFDSAIFDSAIFDTTSGSTAPEISVTGNGQNIVDGDSSPSVGDDTDFGNTTVGGSTISKTYTINNVGTATLTVGTPTVPTGFTLTASPSGTVTAGSSTTFTVRLDASVAGTKSGQVSFTTDDSDENPFNFSIIGTVVDPVSAGHGNAFPRGFARGFSRFL